jgi:hypothetical protein
MKLFEQANRSDGWLLANAFGTYPSQSAGEERVLNFPLETRHPMSASFRHT